MSNKLMTLLLFVISIFLLLDAFTDYLNNYLLVKKTFAIITVIAALFIGYFAVQKKDYNK